jgi:hypothetical protein
VECAAKIAKRAKNWPVNPLLVAVPIEQLRAASASENLRLALCSAHNSTELGEDS